MNGDGMAGRGKQPEARKWNFKVAVNGPLTNERERKWKLPTTTRDLEPEKLQRMKVREPEEDET